MWCIYKHTNKINGKVYIGQTCQKPEVRWGKNGCNYDSIFQFGRAIKKYGWNNFTHEIIENNIENQLLADEREKYWIDYYRSYIGFDDCNGYNMTLGGQGVCCDNKTYEWLKDKIICVETGEIWNSITDCSIETGIKIQNLSQNCCINHKTAKGKHYAHLIEYDENWKPAEEYNSERRKKSSTKKKEVYCLQTNKFYNSASSCANELGLNVREVSRCAKKDSDIIQTHGYNFCYKEDYYQGWTPRKNIQGQKEFKKVLCIEKQVIYNSIKEPAEILRINASSIYKCCLNVQQTAGGYHWKYVEDKD